jgi:hypothetical protein
MRIEYPRNTRLRPASAAAGEKELGEPRSHALFSRSSKDAAVFGNKGVRLFSSGHGEQRREIRFVWITK